MIKVQHSIVSPSALIDVINRQYPAIAAKDCSLLEMGCNDNFLVRGKRQDYVFRLYRKDWWPEEGVDEELRFLEILKRNNVNVCVPRRTSKNHRYISITVPEGKRFGALFGFLAGRPLANITGKAHCNMQTLGEMLARVHEIGDNLKAPLKRWTMGYDFMVEQTMHDLSSRLAHRPKDLAFLHKLAKRLRHMLEQPSAKTLDFGICHGDFHTHNIMLQPDGKIAIFDFDWCTYSWRAYDLASAWWSLKRLNKPDTAFKAMLRGYQRIRKLSAYERTVLAEFVMLRQFELLGFHLANRSHFGHGWLNEGYFDHHMRFFRDWVKTYLSK